VLEFDGDTHSDQESYDQARTEWLNEQGYTVIRFTNQEVFRDTAAVLDAILHECQKRGGTLTPGPSP
jgi:very-short-patch-repair endonuclease